MARKYLSLLTPLFILFWVAGTNHCAIEFLFSSGTPSTQGECEKHSEKSPDSHQEGQPCISKALISSDKPNLTGVKLVQDSLAPVNLFLQALVSGFKDDTQVSNFLLYDSALEPYGGRLVSLTIASNAPPTTA